MQLMYIVTYHDTDKIIYCTVHLTRTILVVQIMLNFYRFHCDYFGKDYE